MSEIPSNRPAEEAVIGCILSGISPFLAPLRARHFASPDLQHIFHGCCDLANRGVRSDFISVTTHLQSIGRLEDVGGPGAVADLVRGETCSAGEALFRYYFQQLEACRQTREVSLCAKRLLPDLDSFRIEASEYLTSINEALGASEVYASKSAEDLVHEIEEEGLDTASMAAMPFGIAALDLSLGGGVLPGELFVVAGETGRGKTACLIQICAQAALKGTKVLYVSLEMKSTEIFKRLVSASFSTAQDSTNFASSLQQARKLSVSIRDDLSDLADIRGAIFSEAKANAIELVVVDYLQLVAAEAETRELAMSSIARTLKSIALRCKIAVVTASQLNEKGQLRESRAIGHHADAVISINGSSVSLVKFRRGPSGVIIPCTLNGSLSRFEE